MSPQPQFEVGDEVYLIDYVRMRQAKIERVTKTQAILENGDRYRQVDGYAVGSDTWSTRQIRHPTPGLDRKWDLQRLDDASTRLSAAALRGIPLGNSRPNPLEIRAAYAVWDKLEKEVNKDV